MNIVKKTFQFIVDIFVPSERYTGLTGFSDVVKANVTLDIPSNYMKSDTPWIFEEGLKQLLSGSFGEDGVRVFTPSEWADELKRIDKEEREIAKQEMEQRARERQMKRRCR